ncbi:hypothetical protein [Arcobacter sp. YIC-80]|uniref:hypothetical protein n=1 Tax=unclassified Arcobacter TaxID=2593671 RepID=UPI0038507B11
MFEKIKEFFKEEEKFPCIIWDGKMMKYLDLSQKEIDNIKNNPKYKNWTVTKKDEC